MVIKKTNMNRVQNKRTHKRVSMLKGGSNHTETKIKTKGFFGKLFSKGSKQTKIAPHTPKQQSNHVANHLSNHLSQHIANYGKARNNVMAYLQGIGRTGERRFNRIKQGNFQLSKQISPQANKFSKAEIEYLAAQAEKTIRNSNVYATVLPRSERKSPTAPAAPPLPPRQYSPSEQPKVPEDDIFESLENVRKKVRALNSPPPLPERTYPKTPEQPQESPYASLNFSTQPRSSKALSLAPAPASKNNGVIYASLMPKSKASKVLNLAAQQDIRFRNVSNAEEVVNNTGKLENYPISPFTRQGAIKNKKKGQEIRSPNNESSI